MCQTRSDAVEDRGNWRLQKVSFELVSISIWFTYVNEGLLDVFMGGNGFAGHVLVPEPGAQCLQRPVGTPPAIVIQTILHEQSTIVSVEVAS